MVIENIMYFALGLLAAGLIALMVVPAIWKRAVRLTQKRIEAATPMTMAEFRADKDQLRAEFALSTRRLEMNVEALRTRLAEQLREINRKKGDLNAVKSDRDNHLTIVRELEEREAELRRRVLELEKESADASQKLRMRDREYADKVAQLEDAREILRQTESEAEAEAVEFDGERLSGLYREDTAHLIRLITIDRARLAFLEQQNEELVQSLETADSRSEQASTAAADLRRALAQRDDADSTAQSELLESEARLADAESRFNALLGETARIVEDGEARTSELLAEKLERDEELARLRAKVEGVETTIMTDWDSERVEQAHLRERLNDIASDVARLVYQVEGREPVDNEESLLERVQRFADDGQSADEIRVPRTKVLHERPAPPRRGQQHSSTSVAERLAAVRDIQGRN